MGNRIKATAATKKNPHAHSHNPTHIAFEHGLERLLVAPFGALRRQCLDTIEYEEGLHGQRVMSRCLLNIAKRSLLRLMLSCVGLASKHAAG
jgi:hypothetical protein